MAVALAILLPSSLSPSLKTKWQWVLNCSFSNLAFCEVNVMIYGKNGRVVPTWMYWFSESLTC